MNLKKVDSILSIIVNIFTVILVFYIIFLVNIRKDIDIFKNIKIANIKHSLKGQYHE